MRRLERRRGTTGVTLAVLCALAIVPPLAFAGGPPPPPDRIFREDGLKYVKTRVMAAPAEDFAGVQVPCGGERWHVVGGGADVVDGFAPAVYMLASHPFDFDEAFGGDPDLKPDDGWEVFVREDAGPDLKVDAWAICEKRGVRYRRAAKDPDPGQGRTVKASCRGRNLIGGGFSIAPVLVNEVSVSVPYDGADPGSRPDDGWTVHGFNDPSAIMGIVEVHATCVRDGDLSYPKKAASAPSMLTTRSPRARCGRAGSVTGGGGSVGSGHIVESHPIDGGDRGQAPDDGWRSTLVVAAGFRAKTFAVCSG